jgi:DNA invertase Pin-like site-specific DNA recombinase
MTAGRPHAAKIQPRHRDRWAVVYVRQSTPQQVAENQESRRRQYELAGYARALGWSPDRVRVIDDDQGRSGKAADGRPGFQQLIADVASEQVGLVLGLEMSRLARSSKDWHHLLELCAVFGTLLADQDGVYDPADCNDRLLLGLKGTMSEFELVTMRNRLERGRLHKAARGELFSRLPVGYVKLPSGEVAQDPDEQARAVVRLVFDTFDEVGSVYGVLHYLVRHDVRLGLRPQAGPRRGELVWRRPALATLVRMLNHPMYAGAYVYGRRAAERKGDGVRVRERRLPRDQWKAFQRDALPAYITWERYEANLLRLRHNRSQFDTPGAARNGDALLAGIVWCGTCGHRLHTNHRKPGHGYYGCWRFRQLARAQECYGLCARPLDAVVVGQVFRALEPAALEASLRAVADEHRERQRLHALWAQRRERARYEADRAERQFQAVEPENRLVARTLEQKWEEALRAVHALDDEWRRFAEATPARLTDDDQRRITALAHDLPAVWHDARTTNADRKEVIRCVVERVVVRVAADSERVDVAIHWHGGVVSRHELLRPIGSYTGTATGDRLRERVTQLRRAGRTAVQIADQLNREGISPPRRRNPFSKEQVGQLLMQYGLTRARTVLPPGPDEWPLAALAGRLGVSAVRLRRWARTGWVQARRAGTSGPWLLWADADELDRLDRLVAAFQPGISSYPAELTTPKPRPESGSS